MDLFSSCVMKLEIFLGGGWGDCKQIQQKNESRRKQFFFFLFFFFFFFFFFFLFSFSSDHTVSFRFNAHLLCAWQKLQLPTHLTNLYGDVPTSNDIRISCVVSFFFVVVVFVSVRKRNQQKK